MTAYKGLGTYGNAVGVVTPLDHKGDQAGQVVKASGNLIRPGLFWGGSATVISGKANMSYDVAAYQCVTTRGATSGAVFGGNDGVLNVVTTAAPGSNSRIDIIYHWHREYSLDGVDSNPVIGVIQGTAAAVPTAPSLAAFPGAIEIGRATVGAGITATTSATITQTAPFTALAGGVVVTRTTTERDASTFTEAQVVYDLATDVYWRYTGSAWAYESGPKPVARLTKNSAQSTSGTPGTRTVTLFNTEDYDPFGLHSTVSNTGRVTVPAGWAGYWRIGYHLEGSSTTVTSTIGGELYKNGVAIPGTANHVAPTASNFPYSVHQDLVLLAVNDYVEVMNFSGAAAVTLTPTGCVMTAEFVGSA